MPVGLEGRCIIALTRSLIASQRIQTAQMMRVLPTLTMLSTLHSSLASCQLSDWYSRATILRGGFTAKCFDET